MPCAPREVGAEPEVEHVAGVVLHDHQDTGAAVDRPDRRLDRVRARAREHLAGARGGQQPGSDEAGVHRLVTGAATGDDGHQAGAGEV